MSPLKAWLRVSHRAEEAVATQLGRLSKTSARHPWKPLGGAPSAVGREVRGPFAAAVPLVRRGLPADRPGAGGREALGGSTLGASGRLSSSCK